MAKSGAKADKGIEVDWAPCQLMLVIEPGEGARQRLEAALQRCQAAAVLIRPRQGQQLGAGEVKPLVDLAQDHGAAAIIFADAQLARTVKADGVHVPAGLDGRDRIAAARATLGVDASIGVDAGQSRHQAMEAGEAGADYVAFGSGDGSEAGYALRQELVEWWADIFEIPCVVLDIDDADGVAAARALGADFAALTIPRLASVDAVMSLAGDADTVLLAAD